MLISDALQLINEAAQGEPEAVRRIFTALKVQFALNALFENHSAKGAFIVIGRHYAGLTIRELGRIFRMSHQHISNIEKEVLNKIEQGR